MAMAFKPFCEGQESLSQTCLMADKLKVQCFHFGKIDTAAERRGQGEWARAGEMGTVALYRGLDVRGKKAFYSHLYLGV